VKRLTTNGEEGEKRIDGEKINEGHAYASTAEGKDENRVVTSIAQVVWVSVVGRNHGGVVAWG